MKTHGNSLTSADRQRIARPVETGSAPRPAPGSNRRAAKLAGAIAALSLVFGALRALSASAAPEAVATRPAAETAARLPFADEIERFVKSDATNPPPKHAVLFLGSSSIRLWKTLAQDFPKHAVINRGFGGSQLVDSIHHFDRIVRPYEPRLVVLYAGGNDINARKTPQRVFEDFRTLATRIRTALPETRLAYISIAPNPARWSQIEQVREANRLIADYISHDPKMRYIDTHSQMLGPDGQPKPDIFVADRLHMNERGYQIWTRVVTPYLEEWSGR